MKAQALLDVTVHSLLLPMNNCDVSGSKKKSMVYVFCLVVCIACLVNTPMTSSEVKRTQEKGPQKIYTTERCN